MKKIQYEKFLENLFLSLGGIITDFGDYFEVDLPSDFLEKLECSNPLRITLQKEVALNNCDIHYMAKGTPFFKKLIKVYGKNTSVTKGYYAFPKDTSNACEKKLCAFLKSKNINEYTLKSSKQVYIPKLEIQFHLNIKSRDNESLISKEVFDVLDIIPIDNMPQDMTVMKMKKEKGVKEVFLQENIIPVFLKVLKTIESKVKSQVENSYNKNQQECEDDKKMVNQFYELVKEELEEKKECLYFHLYFFQKEEKINKHISEQEEEWDLKLKINQLKYRFKAFLDIYNAFIYYFPAMEYSILLPEKENAQNIFYDFHFDRFIIPITKRHRTKLRKKLKKSA
ncbi:hypothetical protein ACFL35_00125 [Candidatus Riflebacteria bacterium]